MIARLRQKYYLWMSRYYGRKFHRHMNKASACLSACSDIRLKAFGPKGNDHGR